MLVLTLSMQSAAVGDATTATAQLVTPATTNAQPPKEQKNIIETPSVRIKDLAHFSAVRDNQLVGYGLVVGLNGTGDTMSRSTFTKESLTSMLERLGVNIRDGTVPSGKNVAAVMVTASLPAFSQPGTRLDVSVSALGDAKELRGGTLLVTPLLGANGNVYAVAQGAVLAAGVQVSGKNAKEVSGVPTCARVMNGAIVERGMDFQLASLSETNLTLHNPDFTTAQRAADAINALFPNIAKAVDASNIRISVPADRLQNLVGFMTEIEQITVQPDLVARVIIDANNNVVTLTSMAKIFPVALTHGSITIKVTETPVVTMPPANTVANNMAGLQQNINNLVGAKNTPNQQAVLTPLIAELAKQQSVERAALIGAQKEEKEKAVKDTERPFGPAQQSKMEARHKEQMATLQAGQEAALAKLVIGATTPPNTTPGTQNNVNSNNPSGAVVTDKTDVQMKEATGKFAIIQSGADLQEFVNALNALGATPKDMMAILQNIKAAGALQAEIMLT